MVRAKINTLIVTLVISLFGLSQEFTQNSIETDNDLSLRIDQFLNESVDNGYYASVLVAKDNKVLHSKGYGWSDKSNNIANKPNTIFNIGSITKQFTATAILKLVETGTLKVTDRLNQFYSNIPEDKANITIHQLLTHTSGIKPSAVGFRYNEATKDDFLNLCFNSELWTKPGAAHRYANANYILLAHIIEKVSGQSYFTFLREHLWKPAQMSNTNYKSVNYEKETIAHGYYFSYSDGSWMDWGITQDHLPKSGNHWYSVGKGDVESTTEDLYKWHQALQSNKILNSVSKKLLETPFVPENQEESSFYGYGWSIFYTNEGKKVVWHNGSNGIYFGNFVRFTDDNLVIIVLSNTRLNNDSENVAWEIAKMITDKEYQPKPITKLSYELVYDFMKDNEIKEVAKLPSYLQKQLGYKLTDKSVLNQIGFKLIKKENTPLWGLELLKLNVEIFPNDGNLWDSLGEAYFIYKQKDNAINAFNKAINLGKGNTCHWCDNSKRKLNLLK